MLNDICHTCWVRRAWDMHMRKGLDVDLNTLLFGSLVSVAALALQISTSETRTPIPAPGWPAGIRWAPGFY